MKRKSQREDRKPLAWQLNPSLLEGEKVQFWRNGVMVTGMMSIETARELVRDGRAFVMCSQAIGALDENGECMA